jgi:hypothetical protein
MAMAWFRGRETEPAPVEADDHPDDSPEALHAAIVALNRFINASAGRLPLPAVVAARRITDVLADVVYTAEVRPLDIHAVISVQATVNDYLPTTLRSFLAVDKSLVQVPRASGHSPVESLMGQLDALELAALTVLEAARQEDLDTLMTQGNFLRTKFSRSDLDL